MREWISVPGGKRRDTLSPRPRGQFLLLMEIYMHVLHEPASFPTISRWIYVPGFQGKWKLFFKLKITADWAKESNRSAPFWNLPRGRLEHLKDILLGKLTIQQKINSQENKIWPVVASCGRTQYQTRLTVSAVTLHQLTVVIKLFLQPKLVSNDSLRKVWCHWTAGGHRLLLWKQLKTLFCHIWTGGRRNKSKSEKYKQV